MMKRGLFVVAVVLTCGSLALGGDMIGINFVGGNADGLGDNSAAGGTVTGDAGVVLQSNWNNMIGADSGGPSAPLIDNTGATTTTTVEWAAPNVWNLGGHADDGGNNSLMRGYLDNFWNLGTLTVRNVPFERYEIYVYGDSDRATGVIDGYRLNNSFNSEQFRTEGNFSGDFVLGQDYVKFANLSIDGNGTDFSITAAQVDGNGAAPISGIQVVNADLDLPELTLTVNRDTGNMTLSNANDSDTTFSGYALLSNDGVLLPDQWDPITGNGWGVTASTVEDLSQDTTNDTTLGPGDSIDLGNAWGQYYDEGDIKLQALSSNGVAALGDVTYVGNNDEAFAFGDLNFDGVIDAADFEDVLRPGYGSDTAGLSIAEAYRLGDLDANMVIDETDALLLKQEIVAAGGAVAGLALANVPEPSTLVLVALGTLLLATRLPRRLSSRLFLGGVLAVFAAVTFLALPGVAGAASIPIANHSIESPVLPWQSNPADPSWGYIIDDWDTTEGGTVVPGDHFQFVEVTETAFGSPSSEGGPQHVGMANGHYIVQDLGVGLEPNKFYLCTVMVGNRPGWHGPDNKSKFSLLAGDVEVGSSTVDALTIPVGQFEDRSFSFFTSDTPELGDITVRLESVANGEGENGGRAHFDNVRLETMIPVTLQVNTDTGATKLLGGDQDFDIDLYRITSPSGALDPSGWNSLEDQDVNGDGIANNGIGWETLGTTPNTLSEIIFAGNDGNGFSTISPGDTISLGRAFGGGEQDLAFEIHRVTDSTDAYFPGLVEYVTGGVLLGDVNRDTVVNGLDVDPFVDVLLNGPYQAEADMNEDDVVNGLDVDPFVDAVVGGGLQAVPEPSTLVLLGLALAGLLARGRLGRRRV